MAVAGEIGVGHLLPEFRADTFIILGALQTAGAVAAGTLQAVTHGLHHFLVFVEPNRHGVTSFLPLL